ncbi:uncharacterized protein LOC144451738 [Glandiceps talaboti]
MAESFVTGNELFVDEKYEEALDAFTKAIETDCKNIKYYLQRSATFHALKKYQDALNDAETALQLDTTNSMAYFRKGIALFDKKETENALKVLQQGRKLEADSQAKFDKWIKKCEDKITDDKKKTDEEAKKLKTQGNEHFKRREYQKAVDAYDKAVLLNIEGESKAVIYGNMANALSKLKHHSQCLEAAKMATQLNPTWKKGHYWKGMAYFHLKDINGALKAFEAGLHMDPSDDDLEMRITALRFCQDNFTEIQSIPHEDWFEMYQSVSKNMKFISTETFAKDIMRLTRKVSTAIRGIQPTVLDSNGVICLTEVPTNALTEKDVLMQRRLKSGDYQKVFMSVSIDTKTGKQCVDVQDTTKLSTLQELVLRFTTVQANKTPFNEFLNSYT